MIELKNLPACLKIAEMAIAHHEAKNDTSSAKADYHRSWQLFEVEQAGLDVEDLEHGGVFPEDRIKAGHPYFDQACVFTKPEYENYKAKKRAEYNCKRRLENAIRGLK